jgi:hypothetical protein
MNFIEIIENERKPKLSGGRRENATLQPGGTNVNSYLVPVNQLPASAGDLSSLKNVMASIKPKKLMETLKHPSDNQAAFNKLLSAAQPTGGIIKKDPHWLRRGGAVAIGKDGKHIYSGSDDPKWLKKYNGGAIPDSSDPDSWRRIGGAYLGADGKVHTAPKGLIGKTKGGKMSALVPSHGHGAYTQIGTNYKLSQFGGAIEPIGNTAYTLSPVLSKGSVGGKRPTGKNLKKLIHLMTKARHHLHGDGMWHDAWNTIKGIATGLYHEFGPQIFEAGKGMLLEALKEGAKRYIGKGMVGGDFWGDVWNGVKAFGTEVWKLIVDVLNSEVVKEIQHEILKMGLTAAKEYAGAYLAGSGRGYQRQIGGRVDDGRIQYYNYDDYKKLEGTPIYEMIKNDKKHFPNFPTMPDKGIEDPYSGMLDMPVYMYKGGKMKHSGEKKPSKRGAIVSDVMKKHGLSLPMASKYVKEHGLY